METYDVIIIGAGQAGNPLSTALANAGNKTALIEHRHVGGTCINVGCTPTKTMIASAEVAHLSRRAGDYGVNVTDVTVNLLSVRERKDGVVSSFRTSNERRLENGEVDLIYGQAYFTGQKTLEVRLNDSGIQRLTAETIIINTGGRPRIPELAGLERIPFLDSTSIMELAALPEHLLILGGGYVALEFGQMFRRFGSRVTIIQHSDRILTKEDKDVSQAVHELLEEDGVDVLLNSTAVQVGQDPNGQIELCIQTPKGEQTLVGSHLLVAIGRNPNTDQLNLDAAGIKTDQRGYIQTNDSLETAVPGIFAAGDVKGGPAFTHISYDDFRILRSNLIEGKNLSKKDRLVPYVVFIDPQLGRIGLTETEAQNAGLNFLVAKMPMSHIARAIEIDRTRGFLKAVVDADSRQILGVSFLGVEGGELMAMVEIAMLGNLPYTTLRDCIFAHPTLAESLNNLFADLP